MWTLEISSEFSEKVLVKPYSKASDVCDAIIKAQAFYMDRCESVLLTMKDPAGKWIVKVPVEPMDLENDLGII